MRRYLVLFAGLAVVLPAACGNGSRLGAAASPEGGAPTDAAPPTDGPSADDASDDLPPATGQVSINGLHGPVDLVRDAYGAVHIYAANAEDAFRVQGYQCARDRTAQLELTRRSATGRLAEVFARVSASAIDADISMRSVGLARAAKAMYDALPPGSDVKTWIDAYADGVSQFNARVASGDEPYPSQMVLFPREAFAPWTAVDVLAVARLQAFYLGYQGDDEIALTDFVAAARSTLGPGATQVELKKRGGLLNDLIRFAPLDPTLIMDGFPNDPAHTQIPVIRSQTTRAPEPRTWNFPADALAAARPFGSAISEVRKLWGQRHFTGSNNWVVGPALTETGNAMLASDPHLALNAPSVFWMVHVTVSDPAAPLEFAGLSFPGIPAVILGFNRHIAWGATTADYDVTDVYAETLTSDGTGVVFGGQSVPFTKVHETIGIDGGGTYDYDVLVVPHHGPVVPTIGADHKVVPPSKSALSIRWTGHEVSHELEAIGALVKAANVDDARTAFRQFQVGAQNWVVADTHGDIFYTSQSRIPKRDKAAYTWSPSTFTGTLPCMTLPGDGSAEWKGGDLEEAFVPHVKNPAKGYVGTANGDQVGVTLDNDPSNDTLPNGEPVYLGCFHDPGFRVGRVHERIEKREKPLSLDDMALIQADARSAMGKNLVPGILAAIAAAEEEKASPGKHPDIAQLVASLRYSPATIATVKDLLQRWSSDSDFDTPAGVSLDDGTPVADAKEASASIATTIFNAWLVRMYEATLADELAAIGVPFAYEPRRALLNLMTPSPEALRTYDEDAKDSILFDDLGTPTVKETRTERVLTSLLDAVDFLNAKLGADSGGWRWGKLHRLRFDALVPLWSAMSIPPTGDTKFPDGFPRHGDGFDIDVAEYVLGSPLDKTSFDYQHGPTQRFVVEMTPAGPVARNVIPGGEVWDPASTHFADEAERWRRNQNRPVPFVRADVAAAAKEHVVYR